MMVKFSLRGLVLVLLGAAAAAQEAVVDDFCFKELQRLCPMRRSLLSVAVATLMVNDDADVARDDVARDDAVDAVVKEPFFFDDAVKNQFFFAEWFNTDTSPEEEEEVEEVDEECVREAFASLSPDCRRELVDGGLVAPRRGPCFMKFALLLPLLLALAWAVSAKKQQKQRRRAAGQQIFAALHGHPELKAQVEALAGVAVPLAKQQQQQQPRWSWLCFMERLIFGLAVGFLTVGLHTVISMPWPKRVEREFWPGVAALLVLEWIFVPSVFVIKGYVKVCCSSAPRESLFGLAVGFLTVGFLTVTFMPWPKQVERRWFWPGVAALLVLDWLFVTSVLAIKGYVKVYCSSAPRGSGDRFVFDWLFVTSILAIKAVKVCCSSAPRESEDLPLYHASSYTPPKQVSCGVGVGTTVCASSAGTNTEVTKCAQSSTNTEVAERAQSSTNTEVTSAQSSTNTDDPPARVNAATQDPPAACLLV